MLAVVILNDTPDFSWWISAIGGHPGRLDSRREVRDSRPQGLRLMSKPGLFPGLEFLYACLFWASSKYRALL